MSNKQKEENKKCKLTELAEDVSIADETVLKCTAGQLRRVITNSSKGLINLDFGSTAKERLTETENKLSEMQSRFEQVKTELDKIVALRRADFDYTIENEEIEKLQEFLKGVYETKKT